MSINIRKQYIYVNSNAEEAEICLWSFFVFRKSQDGIVISYDEDEIHPFPK